MSNETSRRRLEVVGTVAPPVAPQEPTRPDIHVGQLWIAHADAGPDVLVLVTDVADDHVQALLCTDDDGIATETDAVLEPRVTGRVQRLLVHGDGRPMTDDSDPRWEAKMERVQQLRTVKARASELGLRIAALRP